MADLDSLKERLCLAGHNVSQTEMMFVRGLEVIAAEKVETASVSTSYKIGVI